MWAGARGQSSFPSSTAPKGSDYLQIRERIPSWAHRPEKLQLVELPGQGVEHVDHEIDEVHQDPPGPVQTFHMEGPTADLPNSSMICSAIDLT